MSRRKEGRRTSSSWLREHSSYTIRTSAMLGSRASWIWIASLISTAESPPEPSPSSWSKAHWHSPKASMLMPKPRASRTILSAWRPQSVSCTRWARSSNSAKLISPLASVSNSSRTRCTASSSSGSHFPGSVPGLAGLGFPQISALWSSFQMCLKSTRRAMSELNALKTSLSTGCRCPRCTARVRSMSFKKPKRSSLLSRLASISSSRPSTTKASSPLRYGSKPKCLRSCLTSLRFRKLSPSSS
mmetsp:Transcript_54958/g.160371  ORF Transcript_54958/g.160371 Transcript_54958/m.160371 type:complete len:244 (+) Transcript_54958:326-1057(+)